MVPVVLQVTSDDECAQNGTPVIISTRTTQHYDEGQCGNACGKPPWGLSPLIPFMANKTERESTGSLQTPACIGLQNSPYQMHHEQGQIKHRESIVLQS